MHDGTVPVNEEKHPENCGCHATSDTPGNVDLDALVPGRDITWRAYYAELDAIVAAKKADDPHYFDTPANAVRAGDFPTHLYTVYSFGQTSGYGYRVIDTTDRPTAEKHAQMYRGVVTRQEIIADYRQQERTPCTNCKNIAGGWCTECRP